MIYPSEQNHKPMNGQDKKICGNKINIMKREELIEDIQRVALKLEIATNDKKVLKREYKRLKKQLEELPKLEVGKWYKYNSGIFNYQGLSTWIRGYGVDSLGNWLELCNLGDSPEQWTPATPQEVEQALIKEAKKRGFKEGARVHSVNHTENTWTLSSKPLGGCGNYFTMGGCGIFKDGKWATIIEPKVTINGDFTKEELEKIIQTEFK